MRLHTFALIVAASGLAACASDPPTWNQVNNPAVARTTGTPTGVGGMNSGSLAGSGPAPGGTFTSTPAPDTVTSGLMRNNSGTN
jgi:hypothetical protein